MWNVISLVQDLNSCHRVHFLRRSFIWFQEFLSNLYTFIWILLSNSNNFQTDIFDPLTLTVTKRCRCYSGISIHTSLSYLGPVGWGSRIHRSQLCRGVRLPQQVSWIWHYTIWWWGSTNAGVLGNAEYLFIAIAPRSTMAWSGST